MSESEFTANRELASTPKSRPAKVVLAELAAHARAAERRRRKVIALLALVATLLALSTTILEILK